MKAWLVLMTILDGLGRYIITNLEGKVNETDESVIDVDDEMG